MTTNDEQGIPTFNCKQRPMTTMAKRNMFHNSGVISCHNHDVICDFVIRHQETLYKFNTFAWNTRNKLVAAKWVEYEIVRYFLWGIRIGCFFNELQIVRFFMVKSRYCNQDTLAPYYKLVNISTSSLQEELSRGDEADKRLDKMGGAWITHWHIVAKPSSGEECSRF